MASTEWTSEALEEVNARFENGSPRDVLAWGFETFGSSAVMGTGFGYSGVALAHLVSTVRPGATLFYLDTDLLFPETYELRNKLSERLDIDIERVHSGLSLADQRAEEAEELWNSDPDRCCFLRKVKPLRDYLSDKKAWVTAIRRDQSPSRADTQYAEWNQANEVVKINPLAAWSTEQVWDYIDRHELPYNELHDEGYPSIGCIPCTEPAENGADERSGRWTGSSKTECGLHLDVQEVSQ